MQKLANKSACARSAELTALALLATFTGTFQPPRPIQTGRMLVRPSLPDLWW